MGGGATAKVDSDVAGGGAAGGAGPGHGEPDGQHPRGARAARREPDVAAPADGPALCGGSRKCCHCQELKPKAEFSSWLEGRTAKTWLPIAWCNSCREGSIAEQQRVAMDSSAAVVKRKTRAVRQS